jgi:MFS family permease
VFFDNLNFEPQNPACGNLNEFRLSIKPSWQLWQDQYFVSCLFYELYGLTKCHSEPTPFRNYAQVLLLLPLLGFFNNGIFSGFPIYLPELYPTRIRATGAGFCFNIGRVLASTGPFVTGYLVTVLGSFARAASAVAVIYLVGLLILPFAPETKGQPLPP